jgi:hypothetical protein
MPTAPQQPGCGVTAAQRVFDEENQRDIVDPVERNHQEIAGDDCAHHGGRCDKL